MNTTTCTVNNGGPSTADSGSAVNDRFNELVKAVQPRIWSPEWWAWVKAVKAGANV